jgi:putative ABC transport system permease protein
MKFSDLLATSVETLKSNRLRTILTVLGITIGIAALTATLSIMEGTNAMVDKTLAGFGGKFMAVFPDWDPVLRRPKAMNFDLGDARAIRGVSGVTMISLQKTSYWIPVSYYNRQMQTDIYGTDPSFLIIRNRKIEKGRFIDVQDILNQHRICVITEGIKQRFFPAGDYLEQKLAINGVIFEIVGCLEPQLIPSIAGGNSEEGIIFAPLTTCQNLFHQYDYDVIFLRYTKDYESEPEMKLLKGRIRSILKYHKGQTAEYVLKTLDEFAGQQKKLAVTITIALCSVAGLCLLVGGIGITNIMLVNVMERIKEIGIRKAIGAKNSEILGQFLGESVMVSAIGGLAGLLLGIISARIVAICAGMPVSVTWWVVLSGMGFMLLVGIAFGFYPARKAASVQPVECLRHE